MFAKTGIEENLDFDGFNFKYILKDRSYDTSHLIVVFSGFGGKSVFTYDFLKALQSNRSYVVWLKDDFFDNGLATYYIDPIFESDKKLEKAIIKFLHELLIYLQIDKKNCTLLGCSKGGASALFYGIKYGFSNMILSAPTILVGSSVGGKRSAESRKNARFMLGENVDKVNIEKLDSLIIDEIDKDDSLNRNIYLFSSLADRRHTKQVQPFINIFTKYNNFNYIESKSVLVRKHQDVTGHNAPLILGILNTLSFNVTPSFISSIAYGDAVDKVVEITKEPVLDIKSLYFDSNSFFHTEGIYFLRGLSCANDTDLSYVLKLKSNEASYDFKLDKEDQPVISKTYYKDAFVNYDKACFCTKGHKGVDMSHVVPGTYELSIEIIMGSGDSHETSLVSDKSKYKSIEDGEFTNTIYSAEKNLYYRKIETSNITKEPVFDLKRLDFGDYGVVYIEGVYFLRGLSCTDYSDLKYILKLKSYENSYEIRIAKGKKTSVTKRYYKDSLVNYDKAYFCTYGYKGIDISHVEPGTYQLFIEIIMHTGDSHEIAIFNDNPIYETYKDGSYFHAITSDISKIMYQKRVL